jgi:protein TonB
MDTYIDREFEALVPEHRQSGHRRDAFGRMLAASVVFHILMAFYFMSPGPGASTGAIPVFDLSSITFPQPPAEMKQPATEREQPVAPQESIPPTPPTASDELARALDHAVRQAETAPELLQQTSLGLGLSRGYFNSLAEGKSLRGDIRVYYFDMLRRLNEVWWSQGVQGMNPGKHEALVNLEISRDGVLLRRELVRGTGDRQLDRAILAVVDGASPFPPLPDSYEDRTFSAPLRLAVPLNLFSLGDNSP